MNKDYVLLCGVMWCQYRHEDSGWELVRALRSPDSDVSLLAAAILQAAEEFHAKSRPSPRAVRSGRALRASA